MTIEKRVEMLEKNSKFQAKTEYLKWIVSILFFVGLVWLVTYNKKELKDTVYYNKETGRQNKERVDSIVRSVRRNTSRIDYNILRIDSNGRAVDSQRNELNQYRFV